MTAAAIERRLVLASNNRAKLVELQRLFEPLGVQLLGAAEAGVTEPDEPHPSFLENALAKARHASRGTGLPALADDSGLCVESLAGAPGVASAHYAGPVAADGDREARRRAQDAANNRLLLDRLHGAADRRCAFVSTLVALRHADDPQPLVAFGRWSGVVLEAPRGEGGFGYDPLVFIPTLGRSVAELPADEKNRLSHRALAARDMLALMRAHWIG